VGFPQALQIVDNSTTNQSNWSSRILSHLLGKNKEHINGVLIYFFIIYKKINAFSHLYQSKSHAYILESVKVFVLFYCQNDLGLLLMKLTL
jgi:hypothetical protein